MWILFIACRFPVIVRRICLFENFENLSLLLGFKRDILEGWARGCCVHVFLVNTLSQTEFEVNLLRSKHPTLLSKIIWEFSMN